MSDAVRTVVLAIIAVKRMSALMLERRALEQDVLASIEKERVRKQEQEYLRDERRRKVKEHLKKEEIALLHKVEEEGSKKGAGKAKEIQFDRLVDRAGGEYHSV